MTRSVPGLLKSASFTPVLLADLSSLAGVEDFIEDASVSLGLYNLYFNRDFRQSGVAQSKQEEWTQGLLLQAKPGYTQGTLGFGIELIGQFGLKLDSNLDRVGSGLLLRHADGRAVDDYARLGVAPELKLSNTELKLGELLSELPILLHNDGRLLPQAFQGGMLTSRKTAGLTLHGGQMRSSSQRNSSDHQDLSVDGRGGVFSDCFDYLGAEYRFNAERSQVGLWQTRLQDIYRQDYYSLGHKRSFGGWRLGASVGLFDTRDESAAKLDDLENCALTGFFSATCGYHGLSAGYQRMYGDDGMLYIAGISTSLVNGIQVRNFTSVGERSWQLRYDHDFAALGIPRLTAMARYVNGAHARTKAIGDGRAQGCDVDAAYVIQSDPLKDLGLRWYSAMLRPNHAADVDENRLILSYFLSLLRAQGRPRCCPIVGGWLIGEKVLPGVIDECAEVIIRVGAAWLQSTQRKRSCRLRVEQQ